MFYDRYTTETNIITHRQKTCHNCYNKHTINRTFAEISEWDILEDSDAIDYYNTDNANNEYQIPQFVKTCKLFKVRMHSLVTEQDNINIHVKVVIIFINHKILHSLVQSNAINLPSNKPTSSSTSSAVVPASTGIFPKDIPLIREFLLNLIRFHYLYHLSNTSVITYCYGDDPEPEPTDITELLNIIMTGVDYTLDPRIITQSNINLTLYNYQRASIHWMTNLENSSPVINYNDNTELFIGPVYYDMELKQFNLQNTRKKLLFKGGGLIDEVGLGKTIQILALTQINKPNFKPFTSPAHPTKFISTATLIICPNQLCGQWLREIKTKLKNHDKLITIDLRTKVHHDKVTYKDLLEADYIIASYQIFCNKTMTDPLCEKLGTRKNYFNNTWTPHDYISTTDSLDKFGRLLMTNKLEALFTKNPLLPFIHWERIIVDEFHEIYNKNSQYTYMRNLLPFLTAEHKWILTATPFTHSDILGDIIDYLTDYALLKQNNFVPYKINKLLKNDELINHLLSNCFRRNTKETIKHEYTLPSIVEEVHLLNFTQTERMMYNAYLINPSHSKFDVYIRQLCCHPQLAEETKTSLQNCKTLKDIENTMLKHYKTIMDNSQALVNKTNHRINKTNKMIQLKIRHLTSAKPNTNPFIQNPFLKPNQTSIPAASPAHTSATPPEITVINGKFSFDSDLADIDKPTSDDEYFTDEDTGERKKINIKAITLNDLEARLLRHQDKLTLQQKQLTNHTATFNFYSGVIDRIKKTENNKDIDENDEKCSICLDPIKEDSISVTNCGHLFCYGCITEWVTRANNCPQCKKQLHHKDVFSVSFELKKKLTTTEDKDKEKLVNDYGTKLANLILYLRNTKEHVIIFSQWHELLCKVGTILNTNKVGNIFCKGNCYQRDKAIREFNNNDKIKVIMLSSDSMAAGTNLTKASVIIFLDPIYGAYKYRKEQEKQAIGRAHRMGQQSTIKIIRFIIKDSIEQEIYNINAKEDTDNKDYFNKTELNID